MDFQRLGQVVVIVDRNLLTLVAVLPRACLLTNFDHMTASHPGCDNRVSSLVKPGIQSLGICDAISQSILNRFSAQHFGRMVLEKETPLSSVDPNSIPSPPFGSERGARGTLRRIWPRLLSGYPLICPAFPHRKRKTHC